MGIICDVTCQNQTNVGICHLPEIKFSIILEENNFFMQIEILVPNYS